MTATALFLAPEADTVGVPAAELMTMAEAIAGPRSAIESAFLDMGQHLMKGAKLLREISAAHEGLPGEFRGPDFVRAVTIMQELREEIAGLSDGSQESDANIERLASLAQALSGPIESLKKAVKGLSLISVNARIVAAGIEGGGADFGAFTLEMIELGKNARETVARVSQAHEKLVSKLGGASAANRDFRARHADTAERVTARLAGQLATIERQRERAASDAAESSKVASTIGGRIGEAVSALQIGDITRQRLEHIEDGLRAAAALAETDIADDTLETACRLQARQLIDTRSDFERQVATFAVTLRQLADDTGIVLNHSKAQADALLAGSGSALAALVADLQSTSVLLDEYEEMRGTLRTLRREVEASMRVMLGELETVAAVEQSIRLLSLNTAVRCSRLGREGGALKVIAEEMRDFAADTVDAASTVKRYVDDARNMIEAQADISIAADDAVNGRVGAAVALLEGVLCRLRDHVSVIGRAGPDAARLLDEAARSAGRYENGERSWPALIARLQSWGGSTEVAPEGVRLDETFFAGLRAKYTMESERRMHDSICGVLVPAAETAPDEEEIDSMLF